MKWLIMLALALAVIIAIAAIVGWLLPRQHRVSREQFLPVPPEAVWTAITGIETFPHWRRDVTRVRVLPDREGRRCWVEEGRSGKMTFVTEESDAPRRLVVRIADPDLPFGGTWTYDIAGVSGGSRITISEDGEIYNPIFRVVARFIIGYEGTIRSYLEALDGKFAPAGSGS
jgi:uncharacterized protein YndB with AHSA1/START domain